MGQFYRAEGQLDPKRDSIVYAEHVGKRSGHDGNGQSQHDEKGGKVDQTCDFKNQVVHEG